MKQFYFIAYKNIGVQIYWPHFGSNEFGRSIIFNTRIAVGKRTLAISIFGFGFGITDFAEYKCQWMLAQADLILKEIT